MTLYKKLPETPGVYIMKDTRGRILYIGKAVNLRRRVSGYFSRTHDTRIEKLVNEIKKIDYQKTASAFEALILESRLIKKHQPPFNIKETDDKNFLYIAITDEMFPRVILSRGKGMFGPFTSARDIREALSLIRRIFSFNTHTPREIETAKRQCFDYQIGLCPGTCIRTIRRAEYLKTIRNIKLLFLGKTKILMRVLMKDMRKAAYDLAFEKAAKIKKQIFALKHIQDIALISDSESQRSNVNNQKSIRIEGYDISNISGISAVGSMVVFIGDKPVKSEYKKFRIQTLVRPNDTGMLREMLERRFKHTEWPFPQLVLVDGGKGQANAAKSVLKEYVLDIPVVGIAKGPSRKKNEFILPNPAQRDLGGRVGKIPQWANEKTLIRIRDEAHRFAIAYHRSLRAARHFI